MPKVFEYIFVGWSFVRGPAVWTVGFVRSNPKTSLAIFLASHVARGWL